jgi:trehalose 6-phosphate synthase/phosphatase
MAWREGWTGKIEHHFPPSTACYAVSMRSPSINIPPLFSSHLPPTQTPSLMDSFSEPISHLSDDISVEQVRKHVRALEQEHLAKGIPLSGRILHVSHYLPVIATLNNCANVLSPPATPPNGELETSSKGQQNAHPPETPSTTATPPPAPAAVPPRWSIAPRDGHTAMVSGIHSLSHTHEQVIIGWIGDVRSSAQGETIPQELINTQDKRVLEQHLSAYTPRDPDPEDVKTHHYVPVWLSDKVAHGHYDGYCKQSTYTP